MNNKWIKCGLPWTFYRDWKDAPTPPSFKKEEKKEFGKTTEQAYKELEKMLGGAKYATPKYDKVVKGKEYKAAQRKYKRFADEVREWMKTHPLWLKYQEDMKAYGAEEGKKSFCGRELNKPGTLIEVRVGKEVTQFLIGDINTLAGVCDDCMGFGRDAIVVKYKVLHGRV
jgi:hypothetical protein